jgi:mucin-19
MRQRRLAKGSPSVSGTGLGLVTELLEARTLLAAVAWDGGGDGLNWSDRFNWSADVLPLAGDDVSIAAGGPQVRVGADVPELGSLEAASGLDLAGGALKTTGRLAIAGNSKVSAAAELSSKSGLVDVQGDVDLGSAALILRGDMVGLGAVVRGQAEASLHAYARTLDIGGMIRAGLIHVEATTNGNAYVHGVLDADAFSAGGVGGTVRVLGGSVVVDGGTIKASGGGGGGTINIGGNYLGQGPLQNAQVTGVSGSSVLRADGRNSDGTGSGNGGTIIVWSDDATGFYGTASARGGTSGGDGGFIETSGKNWLDVIGANVSADAPAGNAGQWLLDPTNVTVSNSATSGGLFNGGNFTPSNITNANIQASAITSALNSGVSVTINTTSGGNGSGNVTFNAQVSKSAGAPATLTVNAVGNIILNGGAGINQSVGGGPLSIVLSATNGSVNTLPTSFLNTIGGSISITAGSAGNIVLGMPITTFGGDLSLTAPNTDLDIPVSLSANVVKLTARSVNSGSTISASAVEVTATAGSVSLVGNNAVSTIAGSATTSFLFSGGVATAVTVGSVGTTSGVSAQSFVNLNSGNNLSITQPVNSSLSFVFLGMNGALTQSGAGLITAFSNVSINGFGAVNLPLANQVESIYANMGSGSISFRASGTLRVNPSGITVPGGNVQLYDGGATELQGPINVASGQVLLSSNGTVQQSPTGVITAEGLRMVAFGSVSLSESNQVDRFAAYVTGELVYRNAGSFTVDSVSSFGGSTVGIAASAISLESSGGVTLNAPVNAGAGNVVLSANGLLGQTASGVITANGLAASGQAQVSLGNADNIFTVVAASSAGPVSLSSAFGDLYVGTVGSLDGVESTGGSVTIQARQGAVLLLGEFQGVDALGAVNINAYGSNDVEIGTHVRGGSITIASEQQSVIVYGSAQLSGDSIHLISGPTIFDVVSIDPDTRFSSYGNPDAAPASFAVEQGAGFSNSDFVGLFGFWGDISFTALRYTSLQGDVTVDTDNSMLNLADELRLEAPAGTVVVRQSLTARQITLSGNVVELGADLTSLVLPLEISSQSTTRVTADVALTGPYVRILGALNSDLDGEHDILIIGNSAMGNFGELGRVGQLARPANLTLGGATNLNGDIYVGSDLRVLEAVNVTSSISISARGSVEFTKEIDSLNSSSLWISSGGGLSLQGAVGGSEPLFDLTLGSDSNSTSIAADINVSGQVFVQGSFTIGNAVTMTADSFSVTGDIDSTAGQDLTIITSSGSTFQSIGTFNALGNLWVDGPASLSGSVYVAGSQTWNGILTYTQVNAELSSGGMISLGQTQGFDFASLILTSADISLYGELQGRFTLLPTNASADIWIGENPAQSGYYIDGTEAGRLFSSLVTSVTIGRIDGSGTMFVGSATQGNLSISTDTTLRMPGVDGKIRIDSPLLALNGVPVSIEGSNLGTEISSAIATYGGSVFISGPVVLAGTFVAIDTTGFGTTPGGDVEVTGTIDALNFAENGLFVDAGDATVRFRSPLGQTQALYFLEVHAGLLLLPNARVTTVESQVYDASVNTLANAAVFQGTTIDFLSGLSTSAAGGAVSITASTKTRIFGTFGANLLTVTGTAELHTNVWTLAGQTWNDQLIIFGDVVLTTLFGGISFSDVDALGGGGTLSVVSPGDVTFAGHILGITGLTTDAGGQTIFTGTLFEVIGNATFGDAVIFGTEGLGNSTIKVTGTLQFQGPVNVETTVFRILAGELDLLAPFTSGVFNTEVQISPAGALQGMIVGGDANDTVALDITQADLAQLAALRAVGFGSNTYSGTMTITGNWGVAYNATFSAGSIVFNGTLRAPNLRMQANFGSTTLTGDLLSDKADGTSMFDFAGPVFVDGIVNIVSIGAAALYVQSNITWDSTVEGQGELSIVASVITFNSAIGATTSLDRIGLSSTVSTTLWGESVIRALGSTGAISIFGGGTLYLGPAQNTFIGRNVTIFQEISGALAAGNLSIEAISGAVSLAGNIGVAAPIGTLSLTAATGISLPRQIKSIGDQTYATAAASDGGTLFVADEGVVSFLGTLIAWGSSLDIRAKDVDFANAVTSSGGPLTVSPSSAEAIITLGGTNTGDAFVISTADLAALTNLPTTLVIGDAGYAGQLFVVSSVTREGGLTLLGGSAARFNVDQPISLTNDRPLIFAGTAGTTFNINAPVFAPYLWAQAPGATLLINNTTFTGLWDVNINANVLVSGTSQVLIAVDGEATIQFLGTVNSDVGTPGNLLIPGGQRTLVTFAQPVGAVRPLNDLIVDYPAGAVFGAPVTVNGTLGFSGYVSADLTITAGTLVAGFSSLNGAWNLTLNVSERINVGAMGGFQSINSIGTGIYSTNYILSVVTIGNQYWASPIQGLSNGGLVFVSTGGGTITFNSSITYTASYSDVVFESSGQIILNDTISVNGPISFNGGGLVRMRANQPFGAGFANVTFTGGAVFEPTDPSRPIVLTDHNFSFAGPVTFTSAPSAQIAFATFAGNVLFNGIGSVNSSDSTFSQGLSFVGVNDVTLTNVRGLGGILSSEGPGPNLTIVQNSNGVNNDTTVELGGTGAGFELSLGSDFLTSLNSAVESFTLIANTTRISGALTLNMPVYFGALPGKGTVEVQAPISIGQNGSGTSSLTFVVNKVNLSNSITTSGAPVTITTSADSGYGVRLFGALPIDTTRGGAFSGAGVTISGDITNQDFVAGSVAIYAGSGALQVFGSVIGINGFEVGSAASIELNGRYMQAGIVSFSAPVTITGPVNFSGSGGFFYSSLTDLTGTGDVDLQFSSVLSLYGAVNVKSLTTSDGFGNATGTINVFANVTTIGQQIWQAQLRLDGNLQFASTGGAGITFGNVASFGVPIGSIGSVNDGSGVFGLTVFTAGTTAFLTTSISLTSLTTDALGQTSVRTPSIVVDGDISINDSASFNVTGKGFVRSSTGTLSFGGSVSINGAGLDLVANEINLSGAFDGFGVQTEVSFAPAFSGLSVVVGGSVDSPGVLNITNAELARIGSGFASVTFGGASGSGQVSTVGNQTYNFPVVFRSPAQGGSFVINDDLRFTGRGSISFIGSGATLFLNADIITQGTQIVINDSVVIGADVTLDTTDGGVFPAGADITITGFVNGTDGQNYSLTLRAGGGTSTLGALVGTAQALASLTSNSLNTRVVGEVTTSGAQSYFGSVLLTGSTTFNGSALTFSAGITGPGANLVLNSPGVVSVGGGITVASLLSNAGGSFSFSGLLIDSTGDVIFNDAFNVVSGPTTIIGGTGTIRFASTANVGTSGISLIADEVDILGAFSGSGDLLIRPFTLSRGMIIAGPGTEGANELDLPDDELSNIADGFNNITYGADGGTGSMGINGGTYVDPTIFQMNGPGGKIRVNSTVTGTGNGGIVIRGSNSTTELFADIVTNGLPIMIYDSVLVAANNVKVDSTGGGSFVGADVLFNARLNSIAGQGFALRVFSGSADSTFNGDVGGEASGRLGSFQTDATGRVVIRGSLFRTQGDQLFNKRVFLQGSSEISAATATTHFFQGFDTGAHNLTVTSDDFNLVSTGVGTGNLRIQPHALTRNVRINFAPGLEAADSLDIDTGETGGLGSGFGSITYGGDGGSGTMGVNGYDANTTTSFVNDGAGARIVVTAGVTGTGNGGIVIKGSNSTTELYASIITVGTPITILDSIKVFLPSVTIATNGGRFRSGGSTAPIVIGGNINSAPGLGYSIQIQSGDGPTTIGGQVGNDPSGVLGTFAANPDGGAGNINIDGGLINTTGQQTYGSGVVLGAPLLVQTQGTTVAFQSFVTGNSLTVGLGTGAVVISGDVGSLNAPLAQLNINAGSSRVFLGIVYADIFTMTGGTVDFSQMVTLNSASITGGVFTGLADVNIKDGSMTDGLITGPGNVFISGSFSWAGGTINGDGLLTISPTGTFNVIADASAKLLSRDLDVKGLVSWTGGSFPLDAINIHIFPGGEFGLLVPDTFTEVSTPNYILNEGLFVKGGGGITIINFTFDNHGEVRVDSGELQLLGGGNHHSLFTVTNPADRLVLGGVHNGGDFAGSGTVSILLSNNTLGTISGVTFEFAPGAYTVRSYGEGARIVLPTGVSVAVTGGGSAGSLELLGGSIVFNAAMALGNVQLDAGTLSALSDLSLGNGSLSNFNISVAGELSFFGTFTWYSGSFGSPTAIRVLPGGNLILAEENESTTPKLLPAAVTSAGSITWTGGGLRLPTGGTIRVLSGGSFTVGTDAALIADPASNSIINDGTFIKDTAGPIDILLPLVNSGEVRVVKGLLTLSGGGTHTGRFVIVDASAQLDLPAGNTGGDYAGSGTVRFLASNLTIGTIDGANAQFVSGDFRVNALRFAGDLTILSGVSLELVEGDTARSIDNAGTLKLNPHAFIALEGNFTNRAGATLIIFINGTGPGQYGGIHAGGQLILDGTLTIVGVDGYTPGLFDNVTFLTGDNGATGTFTSTSIPSSTDPDAVQFLFYENGSLRFLTTVSSDINRDGIMNFDDFLAFFNAYDLPPDPEGDVNNDGVVDLADFLFFFTQWDKYLQ